MQTVTIDRDFALPPERVFAYLAEHENLEPLFGAKIKRLSDGDDGTRNGPGSSRQMRPGPLPPFVETTTEVVPNELIRYRITKGSPLRGHEGVMRFTPTAGGGTHLHYEITFGAAVPGVDRVVAAMLRRTVPRGLDKVDGAA
jgi:uncharacterized protein YndB with AHSA1/START domain